MQEFSNFNEKKNLKREIKKNYRQCLINTIEGLVEQREVTIGTIKTAYLLCGNGEPVIFLHGAGAGAVTWYPINLYDFQKFSGIGTGYSRLWRI